MFKLFRFIAITYCFIAAQPAYATCSSPTGVAGEVGYNITGGNQYEYCDDTNWVVMGNIIFSTPTIGIINIGTSHSCGIATDSKAYCWGSGANGRLGNNTTLSQTEPVEVHAGEGPGTFSQVSAGRAHSCGIATDSKAYCWGSGGSGRLGNNTTPSQTEPVEVHAGESPGTLTQVSAGDEHSCGIATDGKAYCWGQGGNGRLGNNDTVNQLEPVEVRAGESPGTFTQVSAGRAHSCGIATDGKVYCWGSNTFGQLGNGNTFSNENEPVEVHARESPGTFTQVSAGDEHSCGIATDGKAYCWGQGDNGRLGNNDDDDHSEPVEVRAGESPGTFTQVSAGNEHSCGIATDGKAYCWGHQSNGRLGNDTDANSNQEEPVEVHAGEGFEFSTQVGAGDRHSCGIAINGKAYCWGLGTQGRLGNNLTATRDEPVEVHAGENTAATFGVGISCITTGVMDYTNTKHTYEWCDGSALYEVSDTQGAGGAGCAATGALIAGSEGAMQYDTANNKMVFCGGTNWINIPN